MSSSRRYGDVAVQVEVGVEVEAGKDPAVVNHRSVGLGRARGINREVGPVLQPKEAVESEPVEVIPPGRYRVRAEAASFAPSEVNVEVAVATSVRADLVLRIQQVREEVRVIGEGGMSVQTENADLGRVVSPTEMTELPSLGRSLYDFVALMPGATLPNDAIGIGFAINGGRTQSANYLLDGAENNEISMSAPAMDVSLDSNEEFNVQTNHFSAEYGRNSSFTLNIITKSGSKNFHGSAYDYIRNSAFAANTFDNNSHNFPRPIFNRHQFSGTAGGPLKQRKAVFLCFC